MLLAQIAKVGIGRALASGLTVTNGPSTQLAAVESAETRPAAEGRPQPVTSGRFQVSKFHRLLSGDESEEMTVASRPLAALGGR